MIVIVDYLEAETKQLCQVLEALSQPYLVSDEPEQITNGNYLILPNSQSYEEAMASLSAKKLVKVIQSFASSGKPVLGIGMGLHLLFEGKVAPSYTAGLGLLEGLSEELPVDSDYPLPNKGSQELLGLAEDSALTDKLANQFVTYNHRLMIDCELEQIKAVSQYSLKFPAIIQEKQVVGYQFLPELSGSAGVQAIKNFLEIN